MATRWPFEDIRRSLKAVAPEGLVPAGEVVAQLYIGKTISQLQSRSMSEASRTYFPKLNGIRGIAVLLVLWEHLFSSSSGVGGIGVNIFFVLSGFLISRILLDYRTTMSPSEAARTFYWRRFLRLSPPFYAALAVAFALGLGGSKFTLFMDATYLTNFHVFSLGHWTASSHFWSLAVEEQFYLISFPMTILLPLRWLRHTLLAILTGSFIFNFSMAMAGYSLFQILLPGSAHGLVAGALLALGLQTAGWLNRATRFLDDWRVLAVSAGIVLISVWLPHWHGASRSTVVPAAVDLLSLCGIKRGIRPGETRRWSWLAWNPLQHIGVISYGLYVYHYFVPEGLAKFVPGIAALHHRIEAPIAMAVSFVLAETSWYLMEKPALKLKGCLPKFTRERSQVPLNQTLMLDPESVQRIKSKTPPL
jgi:peptidoglycan/LPS O-acetylase OafA/YrhL